jgi:hypothetical protein
LVFIAKRILDQTCDVYRGEEESNLVNCPKCGNNVKTPVKTWAIPSREPLKEGEQPRHVGIYECPNCKARFRSAVETETGLGETANIKNMVGRIKGIKGELMQTLMNLREKINTLETERGSLMVEIENLRKVAESRVDALENEVSMLRSEAKSLRALLGYKEEEKQ